MPLLPAFVSFASGIALAMFLEGYALYIAIAFVAMCVMAMFFRSAAVSVLAALVALGVCTTLVHRPATVPVTGVERTYTGIATAVSRTDFSQSASVRLLSPGDSRGGVVLMRVYSSMPVVVPGDTVCFISELKPVDAGSVIPGEYSISKYARRTGATAMAEVSPKSITANSANFAVYPPAKLTAGMWFNRERERLTDAIYASGVSPATASFMNAVLTGDSSYLDHDMRGQFSGAGVGHILALSGMHVSVIAMLTVLLFLPMRLAWGRKWELVATAVVLWGYALLTGLTPSVTRAVIMASVVILAQVFRRSSSPMNSLCLAAMLILLFKPRELFAPGFQLSVAACASILMFAFAMTPQWGIGGVLRSIWQWVAVSVAAVIGTGALAAWHFHIFPLCFILSNIPAAAILPLLMGCQIVLLVLNLFGISPEWLVWCIDNGFGLLCRVIDFISGMDGSAVTGVYFSAWLLVPYYLAVIAAGVAVRIRNAAWGVASGLLLVACVGGYLITVQPAPDCEAYTVDYQYATVVLARDGVDCHLLTDAPPTQYGKIHDLMKRHMSGFTDLRGVEFGEVNGDMRGANIYVRGPLWCFADRVVVSVGLRSDLRPVNTHVDYALVSARYFGHITEVCDVLHPDTVVIAPSVSPKMMSRFKAELDSLHVPYKTSLPAKLL